MTFSKKWNLMRHVRAHTGERRFGCIRCHGTFTEKSSLKRHMARGCFGERLRAMGQRVAAQRVAGQRAVGQLSGHVQTRRAKRQFSGGQASC